MAITGLLDWLPTALCAGFALVLLYLLRINQIMKRTPAEVQKLTGKPWTPELLRETYQKLEKEPIDYVPLLPPKLDRRYIVTGGSGLVGGFIVLQLLARGNPPESIRIVDIRRGERLDMKTGPATEVEFAQADITSPPSLEAAFSKPWRPSVANLPLTVFHTAAVIIPSDRAKVFYDFPERVNVHGTRNVLAAARAAGADVFSCTSSGSIALLPVEPFVPPWAAQPRNFWQILDVKDFFQPLRPHDQFFGNYPTSKAVAERAVCDANSDELRTGCIRPVNGVYGNPTDNTLGLYLSTDVVPTWATHVCQNFVHGVNVAAAHLQHEAVLAKGNSAQAGRPWVVTDPNPAVRYGDVYGAVQALSIHGLKLLKVQPVPLVLLSHVLEWYSLLPHRFPFLRAVAPPLTGDIRYMKPGLFSICTHILGSNDDISRPVAEGGLGFRAVVTSLDGMVGQILEWNREHATEEGKSKKKVYTSSVTAAEKIRQLGLGIPSHSASIQGGK
ncbi:hypothetical protein BX600DRAFT_510984 [Xylariales sp. PMI_506]|nr:hypothetical protein BX600DRAFT_510984 [Xylariales sp. PMI_506]